jgi:tRNA (uracil-5-)-methyltransferase
MNDMDKNIIHIESCSIVNEDIDALMPKLLEMIEPNDILNFKLFSIEFMSSSINDMLVTLIYHKKLDDNWIEEAKKLEINLNIKIVGRARKQKIVLSNDSIDERLVVNDRVLKYRYFENGFTQPNSKVNIKMLEWVNSKLIKSDTKDLCELYCGGGNFTISLSHYFRKVLATEISKTSIKSAKINCELNEITNIDFIRMSAEEFVDALNEGREYTRLKDIELKSYDFSTIFVDPPRAGLDDITRDLVSTFDTIIYISCNPETLKRDLEILNKTHNIEHFAMFDQFAYTHHLECGVILKKSEKV